jgi:hypothetical protein
VQAEAWSAPSTRETALRYTDRMRITDALTHGLFLALTSACFTCGDSKGDESGSESTNLPENEYCENPPYPGDAQTQNTCGCGLSSISDTRNPFYVDCVSETCANNPAACPPYGARPTCLWEGDLTTSPGSICAKPCGNGEPCADIAGRPATCEPVQTAEGEEGLCVLGCSDSNPCPSEMICTTSSSLPGFGVAYCIYELSPS